MPDCGNANQSQGSLSCVTSNHCVTTEFLCYQKNMSGRKQTPSTRNGHTGKQTIYLPTKHQEIYILFYDYLEI